MSKRRHSKPEGQGDLFTYVELYPVRRPHTGAQAVDLSLRIKTAMGLALRECSDSAAVVAARIAEMTGRDLSADALYAYTAPSKPEHDIGITRFIAFVRATGATWLWDELVRDDGLVVLEGREAKLAQLGHLRQEMQRLDEARRELERELKAEPVRAPTARRTGGRAR